MITITLRRENGYYGFGLFPILLGFPLCFFYQKKILLKTFFIGMVFFSTQLVATTVKIESKVNKNKVTVGEKLTLLITLQIPKDKPYKLPILSDKLNSKLGEFVIKDYRLLKNISSDPSLRKESIAYTLVSYVVGQQEIPPIKYQYENQVVVAPPIPVIVESVLTANDKTLEPLKPNLNIVGKLYWWVYPGAILILIVVVFFLKTIIKIIIRRQEKPYYESALIQTDRLIKEINYLGINKKNYFKLDRIIKRFYSDYHRDTSILSMTSKQIQAYIQNHATDYSDFFDSFFLDTDTIKFSSTEPNLTSVQERLHKFRKIILEVKEKESLKQQPKKKLKLSLFSSR